MFRWTPLVLALVKGMGRPDITVPRLDQPEASVFWMFGRGFNLCPFISYFPR
jgi:hypothetical protein